MKVKVVCIVIGFIMGILWCSAIFTDYDGSSFHTQKTSSEVVTEL